MSLLRRVASITANRSSYYEPLSQDEGTDIALHTLHSSSLSMGSPEGAISPANTPDNEVLVPDNLSLDEERKNAGGAPLELESPLGNEIGWWTIVLLSLSGTIGTGIFSTPGTILKQTGSVGLALIFWTIGLLAFSCYPYGILTLINHLY
jgi:hypothetical protein